MTLTNIIKIAAINSSTILKEQSDFVCDTINYKTIIKNASSKLSNGGILYLHAGNY